MSIFLICSVSLGLLGAFLLSGTGPRRPIKVLAAIAFALSLLLSSINIIADQLTGNGLDSSITFHLTVGMAGAPITDFMPQIIGGTVLVAAVLLTFALLYRGMGDFSAKPRHTRIYAGLACILLSLASSPGSSDVVRLLGAMTPGSSAAPDVFLTIDDAGPADNPRNFVLLFVEQLEQSYFDDDIFPGLLPNLTALADEGIVFTNIRQVTGTSWSIAGMTSSLCGVPLVGTGASNSMSGVDEFMPLAVCLGDLLQSKGYRLEHLVGSDLDFAGWNKFFRGHGFDSVEGLAELSPELPADTVYSSWGLHDETLLAVATERLERLSAGDQPFGLVLNMLDTHHPSGYPSPACLSEPYGDGKSSLLTAFACSDRLATQWISDLRKRGLLDNTVVMISSDHLSMPNDVWDRLEGLDRRNFVLVLGEDIPAARVDRAGSTLDLGATLMNLIGFDVPGIGLGRDLLADQGSDPFPIADIEDAIFASRGYISSLWSFPTLDATAKLDGGRRELLLGERKISLPALMRFDGEGATTAMDFEFHETFPLWAKVLPMPVGEKFLWFDECRDVERVFSGAGPGDDMLCAAYGTYGTPDIWGERFEGPAVVDLRILQCAIMSPQEYKDDSAPRLVPATTGQSDDLSFDIISSGIQPDSSYIKSRHGSQVLVLPRGLSVVGLLNGGSPTLLDAADTCAYPLQVDNLPQLDFSVTETVNAYKTSYDFIAVVVHDSAFCDRYALEPLFAESEFRKWPDIGLRTPYVALLSSTGQVYEELGPAETSISVSTSKLMQK